MNNKLTAYWFTVNIIFDPPLQILDEFDKDTGEIAHGAFVEFGVTENSEKDAKQLVISNIREAGGWDSLNYKVLFDHVGVIDGNSIQKEIYEDPDVNDSLIQNPSTRGVWYKTGFGFYTDQGK